MSAPSAKTLRDTVMLAVGLSGIIYVTLTQGVERPTLLLVLAALCGFPIFLRSDERTKPPEPPAVPPAPTAQEVAR